MSYRNATGAVPPQRLNRLGRIHVPDLRRDAVPLAAGMCLAEFCTPDPL